MVIFKTVSLLFIANFFMTFAWYGHLKDLKGKPLILVILISWGIAFFEYIFQVPANRLGFESMNLAQLKVVQEVITMSVFSLFAIFYMKEQLSRNYLYATLCLVLACYFIFRDLKPSI